MGCHTYRVGSGRDKAYLRFSEGDDGTTCLCTFPHNYAHEQAIDANTVRSMALLGAAVAMAWHGDLHPNDTGAVVLPSSLPGWVVQAIDEALPGGREGDESPLVKGALDAQGDAERQLFAAQARIRELERQNELLKGANVCSDCDGTGTAGERAEDGAPLVCTACQGGRGMSVIVWPWLWMETAPKDCEIEVREADGTERIAHWHDGASDDCHPPAPAGWYYDAGGHFQQMWPAPTHWRHTAATRAEQANRLTNTEIQVCLDALAEAALPAGERKDWRSYPPEPQSAPVPVPAPVLRALLLEVQAARKAVSDT